MKWPASPIDSFYVGHWVLLNGRWKRVSQYDGDTKVATMSDGSSLTLETTVPFAERLWIVNGKL